jgi:rSAM/selenodomain-associated transferase 1
MLRTSAIGIMCKAPHPGLTKTRLGSVIGNNHAAALSACFLRDVAAAIEDLPRGSNVKGYGVYAPAGTEEVLSALLPPTFDLLLQTDFEFGRVLYSATERLLKAGHDCVVLVNGDSPTLPSRLLLEAILELRRHGDRLVLGPASDGGYYLIGLKRAHRRLFEDIPWGTSEVAKLTLARAAEIEIDTVLLPEWYDVDDAVTLGWLLEEIDGRSDRFINGGAASATGAYLKSMSVAAQ